MKIFIIFLIFISTYSFAASFDCNKASTNHEKMICNSPDLNEADEKMGKYYFQILDSMDTKSKKYIDDVEFMKLSKDKSKQYSELLDQLKPQVISSQKSFNKKYKKCQDVSSCLAFIDEQMNTLTDISDPMTCFQPMDTITMDYCGGLIKNKTLNQSQKYYKAAIKRFSTKEDYEEYGIDDDHAKKVVESLLKSHELFNNYRDSFCNAAYNQAGGTRRGNVFNNCIEVLTQRYIYNLWDQFLSDSAGRDISGYPPKPKINNEILF